MQLIYTFVTLNIILTLVLCGITYKLYSHYNSLTQRINKKQLIDILSELITKIDTFDKALKVQEVSIKDLHKKNQSNLQKIGFMRFNPFADTGGNQSFVLTLLDEKHNGIVLSSLHSRENTRIYAKKINQGQSPDQSLSKEEEQLLSKTISK